jgi:hypothetical protein
MEELFASLDPDKAALVRRYVKTMRPRLNREGSPAAAYSESPAAYASESESEPEDYGSNKSLLAASPLSGAEGSRIAESGLGGTRAAESRDTQREVMSAEPNSNRREAGGRALHATQSRNNLKSVQGARPQDCAPDVVYIDLPRRKEEEVPARGNTGFRSGSKDKPNKSKSAPTRKSGADLLRKSAPIPNSNYTPHAKNPIPIASFTPLVMDTSVRSPASSQPQRRQPRSHRSDPRGFSYVASYTEQRNELEVMKRELEHAQALLQEKMDELRRCAEQVQDLEQEGRSKTQRIQKLQQQVDGLAAKEDQLASAVQQLSKSGERALLALQQEKQEHDITSQRLGQLEVSAHKTITETEVAFKDLERQLQQQHERNEAELKSISGSLEVTKARAENSEREIDVLRGVLREKQQALCEMAAEHEQLRLDLHAQLFQKDAQKRELEVKLDDSEHTSRSERVMLQSTVKDLQAQLKEAEELTKSERIDASRALERVQAELGQMRTLHTRELQIAANEHLSVTHKIKETQEEVLRLRGVLQLREQVACCACTHARISLSLSLSLARSLAHSLASARALSLSFSLPLPLSLCLHTHTHTSVCSQLRIS